MNQPTDMPNPTPVRPTVYDELQARWREFAEETFAHVPELSSLALIVNWDDAFASLKPSILLQLSPVARLQNHAVSEQIKLTNNMLRGVHVVSDSMQANFSKLVEHSNQLAQSISATQAANADQAAQETQT